MGQITMSLQSDGPTPDVFKFIQFLLDTFGCELFRLKREAKTCDLKFDMRPLLAELTRRHLEGNFRFTGEACVFKKPVAVGEIKDGAETYYREQGYSIVDWSYQGNTFLVVASKAGNDVVIWGQLIDPYKIVVMCSPH
jgi:hypothetical protein